MAAREGDVPGSVVDPDPKRVTRSQDRPEALVGPGQAGRGFVDKPRLLLVLREVEPRQPLRSLAQATGFDRGQGGSVRLDGLRVAADGRERLGASLLVQHDDVGRRSGPGQRGGGLCR